MFNKKLSPIIYIVIILLVILSGCSSEDYTPGKADASVEAENLVLKQLKAPSTAKFQSYSSENVTALGNNKYIVKGYVDAQNGFGAMIRNNFEVEVEFSKDSGTWMVSKSIRYLGD